MSDRALPSHSEGERGRAAQRLQAAVAEQSRLRHKHETANNATDEMAADVSLRTADDQVTARARWLQAVDDHHSGGAWR
jgi:hypothetical protein